MPIYKSPVKPSQNPRFPKITQRQNYFLYHYQVGHHMKQVPSFCHEQILVSAQQCTVHADFEALLENHLDH